jgi:hypothetical protein
MWTQRIMWVAWPAFVAACLLELLVFAVADPLDLQWSGQPLGGSRQGIYTVSFFVFWLVGLTACGLTTLLRMGPGEVNSHPPGSSEGDLR